MNKIKFFLALWLAKISTLALKITKHRGTNFPGLLALKICPDFLKYIAKPKNIIAVTGTNGKTTVNNLINDMLEKDGKKVLNNRYGSNINTGISTSLINGTSIFNNSKYEIASFEIDERSAVRVYPYLKPDYILVTNLSRDSIMRNAHPEYISKVLTDYIPKTSKLILNADDLISSNISPNNKRVYFGIDKMPTDLKECKNIINDMQICPKCSTKLKYDYVRYHHIGKAYCPKCHFKSPEYDYKGSNINLKNMTIDITDKKGTDTYKLLNNSIHNIYNVLSAVTMLKELGYSKTRIKELLESVAIVKTRYNETIINGIKVVMLLAKDKNALGTSRAMDYASNYPGEKQIILSENNEYNISWTGNILVLNYFVKVQEVVFMNEKPCLGKVVYESVSHGNKTEIPVNVLNIGQEYVLTATPDRSGYNEEYVYFYVQGDVEAVVPRTKKLIPRIKNPEIEKMKENPDYEVREVANTLPKYVYSDEVDFKVKCKLYPEMFSKPGNEYNGDLALLSVAGAGVTYNYNFDEDINKYLKEFMNTAGFSHVEYFNGEKNVYEKEKSDVVFYAIGHRIINVNNKTYNLIY